MIEVEFDIFQALDRMDNWEAGVTMTLYIMLCCGNMDEKWQNEKIAVYKYCENHLSLGRS